MAAPIGLVCGSFHKNEIERMLAWAKEEAEQNDLEVIEVVWVPGAMEVPLAIDRLLGREDISAVACLGIIERGQLSTGWLWVKLSSKPSLNCNLFMKSQSASALLARALNLNILNQDLSHMQGRL